MPAPLVENAQALARIRFHLADVNVEISPEALKFQLDPDVGVRDTNRWIEDPLDKILKKPEAWRPDPKDRDDLPSLDETSFQAPELDVPSLNTANEVVKEANLRFANLGAFVDHLVSISANEDGQFAYPGFSLKSLADKPEIATMLKEAVDAFATLVVKGTKHLPDPNTPDGKLAITLISKQVLGQE